MTNHGVPNAGDPMTAPYRKELLPAGANRPNPDGLTRFGGAGVVFAKLVSRKLGRLSQAFSTRRALLRAISCCSGASVAEINVETAHTGESRAKERRCS